MDLSQPAGLTVQRVGVFGGAFDPPHHAHVALAQAAVTQLQLDKLVVVPTGVAWHKSTPLSPAVHRVAMAKLAFEHLPRVVVDDRETHHPGPSYTRDTLNSLRAETPAAQWFLLLGLDQWQRLPTWHLWREMAQLATIVVAVRPSESSGEASKNSQFDARLHGADVQALALDMPPRAISSTDIRLQLSKPLQRGDALQALVPAAVAGYISQHHLYQATS